jgi:competence protein ComGC
MEFSTSRGTQAPAPARVASNGASAPSGNGGKSKNAGWKSNPMWMRAGLMVLLFAGTILIVALLVLIYFGGAKKEDSYIDKNKEQAVFLANGQVYFGKIQSVNKEYVSLKQIYYLNVNQQVQPNQKSDTTDSSNQSVSLVKLGCELHGPTDQMIINRDQVTFWENLKTDGQVTKAITQWVQQNPNGQNCSSNSNSTSTDATKP